MNGMMDAFLRGGTVNLGCPGTEVNGSKVSKISRLVRPNIPPFISKL